MKIKRNINATPTFSYDAIDFNNSPKTQKGQTTANKNRNYVIFGLCFPFFPLFFVFFYIMAIVFSRRQSNQPPAREKPAPLKT